MPDGPANDEIVRTRITKVLGAAGSDPYPPEVSVKLLTLHYLKSAATDPLSCKTDASRLMPSNRMTLQCPEQSKSPFKSYSTTRLRAACVAALHQLFDDSACPLGSRDAGWLRVAYV